MKKDNLIFIHKLLKAIADSIIKVFIPLYILKESNDIKLAMGYLVIYSSFVMIWMFIFKKVIQKYGVIGIMLHFIPIIATMAIFSFSKVNLYTVIASAILMAISQALYSVPLNLIFTFGDKKSNVGKFQIPSNIGKLIFTLISGYILGSEIKNSFLFLSIASSIFYIACVFPLFFAYNELKDNYNNFKELKEEKVKINPWFIAFHIAFGLFQPIIDNVVPLYVYINGLSFKAVTLMIVLVEFLKILINYISQKLVKRKLEIICVIIGSILFVVSLICIIFIKSPIWIYVFSTTCSISFPLTFVPMFRLYCNYLRGTNNVFRGMTVRDFNIFMFRPGLYSLSYIGFGMLPTLFLGVAIIPVMLFCEIKLIKDRDNNLI